MKIAIDLQACQTPGSRRRGIGRYSLELAKGILRNRGSHQVQLLLNHAFSGHDDALKEELADGTGVSFETYRLLAVDGGPRERRRELRRINDEILNWRYACCGADVLHVSSVFEAWGAPGAHVDARIADVPGVLRSATLYDLIPLLFADAYLAPSVRAEYIATLGVFQQMDLILAISESARRDAIAKLDILPERIANIGAAVSGAFGRIESIDPERSRETLRLHGLRSRFVLYTGAADPRKNVDFLLRAYAALPTQLRKEVQLAIVSGLHEAERRALAQRAAALGIEDDVALIGYIPDEDLNLLYNCCDLFVLPSLYEGFGLPLLEAMTCGACVIASDASSLPEIVGRSDVLFDPTEHAGLTRMMRDLLDAPERRRELGAANLVRSRQFSWDSVARAALEAMEESSRRKAAASVFAAPRLGTPPSRPRIALFSPLPPQRDVAAAYVASMLPLLARHFDVELVVAGYTPALDEVAGRFAVLDIPEFRRRAGGFDAIVHQPPGAGLDAGAQALLAQFPGIVVVDDVRACVSELRDAIGHARGIIVHSRFEQELLASEPAAIADIPVRVVPRAEFVRAEPAARRRARARLRLSDDDLLLGMLAPVSDATQFRTLLDALAGESQPKGGRRLNVVYVGDLLRGPGHDSTSAAIANHPIRDRIRVTGPLDPEARAEHVAALDVAVCLQLPSGAEAETALQGLLAAGCAVILGDGPESAHIPGDAAYRVDAFEAGALARAARLLIDDGALRLRLGQAAAGWVREELHPARVAEQFADAIAALAALDRARCAAGVTRRVAELVAGSGLQREALQQAEEAIAAGIELHPASARRMPLRT
ncbi:MAG TPA: glycosyltransferase [Casimicrobiaceae bacterium]|nr:glycosyltransferase [Casimicrobiaceae bacterium]